MKRIVVSVCLVFVLLALLVLPVMAQGTTEPPVFPAAAENLAIAGVPVLLGIFGLVSFAKSRGMKGNALAWLSFGLGVVLFASMKLMVMYPIIKPWVELAWFALAGPAVSGLYDQAREWATGKSRSVPGEYK